MGMVVRTNVMGINANRQLNMNNSAVSKSLEKLSSGFRINRAGDDASGLAISEKMKAQIKGLEQASANAQDAISLVQTAEGATTEIHNMLNRMVELATKAANGTYDTNVDRKAIQDEVDSLMKEINYNGGKVIIDHCFNEKDAIALKEQILASYPNADVRLAETRGLCSFYAEVGGLLVGVEA